MMKSVFVFLIAIAFPPQTPATPQSAVDELLAADRAFSAAAATKSNVIDALSPMFAADVIMPQPLGKFAHGVDEAVAYLKTNPDNATAKAEWAPIRGGISADGMQGFTFGFMTLRKPDGTTVPLKYMSYWVKSQSGWRVAAYKRSRRPEGPAPAGMMAPSLPAKLVPPAPAVLAEMQASLAAAEKAFSDESQQIGLGPAFVKYGAPDAVNMGPDAAYLVGNDKIGAFIGANRPEPQSPVRWAADERVIVASTGDLGVSIGFIRQNADAAATPNAFFTIWRKTNGVWRYIAE